MPKKAVEEERLGPWALGKFSSRLKVIPSCLSSSHPTPETQPATRRELPGLDCCVNGSAVRCAAESGCSSVHCGLSTF